MALGGGGGGGGMALGGGGGGGGGGDATRNALLASIQSGAKLKKAPKPDANKPAAAAPAGGGGGGGDAPSKAPKGPSMGGMGMMGDMAAIMAQKAKDRLARAEKGEIKVEKSGAAPASGGMAEAVRVVLKSRSPEPKKEEPAPSVAPGFGKLKPREGGVKLP